MRTAHRGLVAACLLAALAPARAQLVGVPRPDATIAPGDSADPTLAGTVIREQKISETQGGFGGVLTPAVDPYADPGDLFGISVAPLGDLDGDGIGDIAVGSYADDDGGFLTGSIWIVFLNADQTVKGQQKISETQGGFTGPIDKADLFGWSLGALGDLDGDGAPELAVGGWLDDDGFGDAGAIWILSLNPDGTVMREQKISALHGGFTGQLEPGERFGTSLVNLGDLDGDGVNDLAAGAVYDNQGGHLVGAEWILFLNPDGTVKSHTKITNGQGGFSDTITTYSRFSYSACSLGDLDGDGVTDLAVGAITDWPKFDVLPWEAFGCHDSCGAVWIVFLNSDGTVKTQQKIAENTGGFTGAFTETENFAHAVVSPGDLDGDGVQDLLVGAVGDAGDGGGGPVTGTVWVLFLNRNGTVKGHRKIDGALGGFTGELAVGDFFGQALASLGDLNGDGIDEVAVGTIGDDDGGLDQGAVWLLYLYGANWSSAGAGTPGGAGPCKLAAESSLQGGDSFTLRLQQAAPLAPALLLMSTAAQPLATHGGTLVPSLSAPHIFVPLLTNAGGGFVLSMTWPAGLPAGLPLWFQCWTQDAGGAGGYASSNTLVGTTP